MALEEIDRLILGIYKANDNIDVIYKYISASVLQDFIHFRLELIDDEEFYILGKKISKAFEENAF